MGTKELGQVDPSGNYGLGQAEADKARAWAKEKALEINADPTIPRRHRAGKIPSQPGCRPGSFRPPGRVCVVCNARFLRIVPKGVPPLCAPHLTSWEGGGLPEVRQMIEAGELVEHDWLGMVTAKQLARSILDATGVTSDLKGRVTGSSVTSGGVTSETPGERKKRLTRERVKAHRKAKRRP